ncbi:unnamed protein product [Brassicogethes aeneus]|uniref:Exoribonuclease phosphorolytic domain-containing protein n=1 Tax=Brassicogethes aeneus TaxID=1431903 RepID=A0A9P0B066_BRAAE|nr:unnamed protein product [Brassicogethes aeneus]
MEKGELQCKFGILSRPDGSVMLSEGNTTVIAGIYGPVEVKMQKVLIEKAAVECHYRPKSGLPGVEDRFYESIIRNICETALAASMFPRSAISVVIQEMQNSGELISCAINAACLACLDSGIDMKCMFAAVSCFLGENNQLSLVPPVNRKEIKATFVFVFDNICGKIIASHTDGKFSESLYEEALYICMNESKNIFSFFKKSLFEREEKGKKK